jgi:hypothetical protein
VEREKTLLFLNEDLHVAYPSKRFKVGSVNGYAITNGKAWINHSRSSLIIADWDIQFHDGKIPA